MLHGGVVETHSYLHVLLSPWWGPDDVQLRAQVSVMYRKHSSDLTTGEFALLWLELWQAKVPAPTPELHSCCDELTPVVLRSHSPCRSILLLLRSSS